jgi:hypothetical protein
MPWLSYEILCRYPVERKDQRSRLRQDITDVLKNHDNPLPLVLQETLTEWLANHPPVTIIYNNG